MNYIKERTKMRLLLIGGVILAIVVLFMLKSMDFRLHIASFNGAFLLATISCYPLAIIYGHRQIVDVFNSIRMGDCQPFRVNGCQSSVKSFYIFLNLIIATFTIIFFGWIYGAYNAYKKLQMLKSFHAK